MYYRRKILRRDDMKPRIFVSSTFYDLKYVREDLSNFIKAHDFEPVMFEDGDIGYTPGRALDRACYETMHSADMVLLIIGGNYGSPAEGEVKDEFKEYISITRNEFKSAVNEGIPIYVFIDGKVYVEYEIYEMNYEEIEHGKTKINFKNVKDINVFRFIREIKNLGNLPITEFDKIIQIKDFLSKQWSDMFKKYLAILKENKENENIKNAVEDMNLLVQKMDLMLDSVGKKILSADNSKEYENVVEMQNVVSVCQKISRGISLENASSEDSYGERKKIIGKFVDVLDESMSEDIWEALSPKNVGKFFAYFKSRNVEIAALSMGFIKNKKDIQEVIRNSKTRERLINELVKDRYYLFMVKEAWDNAMEEDTENTDA